MSRGNWDELERKTVCGTIPGLLTRDCVCLNTRLGSWLDASLSVVFAGDCLIILIYLFFAP